VQVLLSPSEEDYAPESRLDDLARRHRQQALGAERLFFFARLLVGPYTQALDEGLLVLADVLLVVLEAGPLG
jgi:hypothetical protein